MVARALELGGWGPAYVLASGHLKDIFARDGSWLCRPVPKRNNLLIPRLYSLPHPTVRGYHRERGDTSLRPQRALFEDSVMTSKWLMMAPVAGALGVGSNT